MIEIQDCLNFDQVAEVFINKDCAQILLQELVDQTDKSFELSDNAKSESFEEFEKNRRP